MELKIKNKNINVINASMGQFYIGPALRCEGGLVQNESLELTDEKCEQHEAPGEGDPVAQTEEGSADAEHAERDAKPRDYEHHRCHAKHVHARVLRLGGLQTRLNCNHDDSVLEYSYTIFV